MRSCASAGESEKDESAMQMMMAWRGRKFRRSGYMGRLGVYGKELQAARGEFYILNVGWVTQRWMQKGRRFFFFFVGMENVTAWAAF